MIDSPHWRNADRMTRGRLDQILADYVADGLKSPRIAAQLFADHGIEVSDVTVAKWCRALQEQAA